MVAGASHPDGRAIAVLTWAGRGKIAPAHYLIEAPSCCAPSCKQPRMVSFRPFATLFARSAVCILLVAALRGQLDAVLDEARKLLARGQHSEALTRLLDYVRREPGDPRGYLLLGRAQADADQLDRAVSSLREAAARAPDLPAAHLELGIVEARRGDPDDAKAAFRKALELNFNYAQARFNLGLLLFQENDCAKQNSSSNTESSRADQDRNRRRHTV